MGYRVKIDFSSSGLNDAINDVLARKFLKLGAKSKSEAETIITFGTNANGDFNSRGVTDRSGRLKNSITFDVKQSGGSVQLEMVSDAGAYGLYQHEGTGIYGSKKQPIRPVKAKFLSWINPDTGERVFAKEVKGVKPLPFLRQGVLNAINKLK